jgi:hypothetical protein
MIMYARASREALTRSLLIDGHFLSVAGALKSIRVSDMLDGSPFLACGH